MWGGVSRKVGENTTIWVEVQWRDGFAHRKRAEKFWGRRIS